MRRRISRGSASATLTYCGSIVGDKRYFGARNLLHDHSIFGTDFVFDTIPNQLVPFDWDEFHKYQGKYLVGVTNAKTGKAEYLDGMRMDRPCTMLRATCAIPIYFPPVQMDGETYYDGGLADPIPIRAACTTATSAI